MSNTLFSISRNSVILKPFKRNWIFGIIVCISLMMCLPSKNAYAQNFQLWMEADIHKDLGKSWKYNAAPNFRKYLEKHGWYRIGLKNTFNRKIKPWLTAEGGIDIFYTVDKVYTNIGEIRPRVAAKFIYPKFLHSLHLDKPYFYTRLEQRFLWYSEDHANDQKTRIRMKVGGKFILNNEKIMDKTFYIPWYAEGFFNLNGEAFEQNASKGRVLLGLGYVFSQEWRGEFDYIILDSRNTLEGGFDRTDNIFQLKVDYYLD